MEFNKIYSEHHDKVLSWVNFKIGNKEAAEELTSDIFMKVHKNLTEYDAEKSALQTWIMNITKNSIIDYWRTEKKGLIVSIGAHQEDDRAESKEVMLYTDFTNPETNMVNEELGLTIEKAVRSLPQAYQTIVDMFFLKEKSHEEISTDLNVPIGTVKGTIHRAKKMLQKRLTNF